MNDERPTHLDLFSGIGGFSLAFEAEGFRTIGFSEIDPYASAVLKKHWPHVRNYGDVRNVPEIGCDVLTGGFPCQPFSQVRQSGKRKGKAGDRYLWPAMLNIIQRNRPTWIVGENVPGIIDLALDTVSFDLEAAGYEVQSLIVPACSLDAAHIRERVWILAHATSQRCVAAPQIHTAATSQSRRKKRTTGPHWKSIPELAASNQRALSLLCEQPVPTEPVPTDSSVHDGISEELDGIKAYGNSIVPQVAQIFARAIYQQIR